jgi:HAD superfamily hydrolase (TIGR01509 family)
MLTPVAEPVPVRGVIFDFHATLVDVDTEDPDAWVRAALRHLGRAAEDPAAPIEGLGRHLDRIWEHATTFDPDSERDLSAVRHREVFSRAVGLFRGPDGAGVEPELVDALYTVMADQWVAFADTVPVLRELRARGVRVVLLSNIGMDIRARLAGIGVADLIDGLVLSYEVGAVKPEPAIFARALELLKLPAAETLMVGDSWRADAGGAALGIRTLILPRTVGPVHGLASVLRLVGPGAVARTAATTPTGS